LAFDAVTVDYAITMNQETLYRQPAFMAKGGWTKMRLGFCPRLYTTAAITNSPLAWFGISSGVYLAKGSLEYANHFLGIRHDGGNFNYNATGILSDTANWSFVKAYANGTISSYATMNPAQFAGVAGGTPLMRRPWFITITKGTPWTQTVLFPGNTTVERLSFDQVYNLTVATADPSRSGYTARSSTATVVNEAAYGFFDHIAFQWDRAVPELGFEYIVAAKIA
jgi:hypothetical protein